MSLQVGISNTCSLKILGYFYDVGLIQQFFSNNVALMFKLSTTLKIPWEIHYITITKSEKVQRLNLYIVYLFITLISFKNILYIIVFTNVEIWKYPETSIPSDNICDLNSPTTSTKTRYQLFSKNKNIIYFW